MVLENKNSKNKPVDMVRYPLASATRRIFTKILDILILSILVVAVGLAIFSTEPGFDWYKIDAAQPWRYVTFVLCMLVLFFGLMLLLPRLTGWTLAMKLLRIKYVNVLPLSSFGLNLFKHELFIWEIMCFISFVLGITLSLLPKDSAISMMYAVMSFSKPEEIADMASYYGGVAIAAFYYVSMIMLIIVFIGVCIKSKRPAFHDKFSNIVVVYLNPANIPDKNANLRKTRSKRINYGIPGEINTGSFDETDNLG